MMPILSPSEARLPLPARLAPSDAHHRHWLTRDRLLALGQVQFDGIGTLANIAHKT